MLRNRGYDSAGMATSSESGLMVSKYASRGEGGSSVLVDVLSAVDYV